MELPRVIIITIICVICQFVTTTLSATLLFSSKADLYNNVKKTFLNNADHYNNVKKTFLNNADIYNNVKKKFSINADIYDIKTMFSSKADNYDNVIRTYPSNVHKSGVFFEKYSNKLQRKNWPFHFGKIINCGNPKTYFSIYWYPRDLSPTGTLTFFFWYTAAHDFSYGVLVLQLYLAEFPDDPVFEDSWPIDCNEAKGTISCPVKQGQHLYGIYKMNDLQLLKGYEGNYILRATVSNEAGQEMFCGVMNVKVLM